MKPNSRSRRRGANLIEFAIGGVVFFIVLFGVMDWAWVFFEHQTLLWRASDAARWAAANRLDQTMVRNIVVCGSPTCSGPPTGFLTGATVTVELVSTADQVDPPPIPPLTRYYARVTVSDYEIRQFTPFIGTTFRGRPIVVAQPMECQASTGNCQDWT